MSKTTNFLAILLCSLLLSCQQSATNTDAANTSTDTVVTTSTAVETPKAPNKLEAIDIENNKIIEEAGEEITKAVLKKEAIIFYRDDSKMHRIFGYETADVNSKRLLAVSAFTNDVEGNPFGCELGAYYDMKEIKIKYLETAGTFVKAEVVANGNTKVVFFESKWVESEE